MDTPTAYAWISRSLDSIHRANWYRAVKPIAHRPGPIIQLDGQPVLNFASNDYLGLAGDDRLIAAAIAATQEYGTGSTGSRLITGHRPLHRQLEQAIATLKKTEDAIVFSSGYLANVGTISAIVGQRDLILSDQYNHSSLKAGATLSGATTLDYDHGNLAQLRQLLEQYRAQYRRCLLVTDGVFSMDGDLCPLPELLNLADEFDCMTLIDEAHATGVLGRSGAGSVEHFNCGDRPLIQVGTLSKAIASLGGYVAGSAELIDFLRNRCATWIYTTALSPADTAAALTAIALIQQDCDRRQQLWQSITWLKPQLAQWSRTTQPALRLLQSDSAIFCLECDRPATALHLSQTLQSLGFFISAIRPPTVPTSRLRLTLMATHQPDHLTSLIQALYQISP
jgi:8-amino-7-oxononanoate synthase